MDTRTLLRRGLRLEAVTLGWNVVGSVVVIAAAIRARSVALAGFGLDSIIEIFASIVVIWELRSGEHDDREMRALRLIGAAFVALSIYLAAQSLYTLATGFHPDPSPLGIAWVAATVVVMLVLARGKAVTGRALDNHVLLTESRVTLVDGYLATAVVIGLVLNAAFGLWWADPVAGLAIVVYGAKEGVEALRHRHEDT